MRRPGSRRQRVASCEPSPVLFRLATVTRRRPGVLLDPFLLLLLQRLQDLSRLLLGHLARTLLRRGLVPGPLLLRGLLRRLVLLLVLVLLRLLLLLLLFLLQQPERQLEIALGVRVVRPGAQRLHVRLDRLLRLALHQERIAAIEGRRLRQAAVRRRLGAHVLLDRLVVLLLPEQDVADVVVQLRRLGAGGLRVGVHPEGLVVLLLVVQLVPFVVPGGRGIGYRRPEQRQGKDAGDRERRPHAASFAGSRFAGAAASRRRSESAASSASRISAARSGIW